MRSIHDASPTHTLTIAPPRVKAVTWMLPAVTAFVIGSLAVGVLPAILLSLLTQALIEAMFATSLGLLHRHSGRISFGHAAYFGLAAYTVALLFKSNVVPAEATILLAIVLPTVLAFAVGLLIARIPGVAHAMLTLATGQALYEVAFKWRSVTNGDDGMTVTLPRSVFGVSVDLLQTPAVMFSLVASLLVIILLLLAALGRSAFGALTEAIRDNPERAKFLGYGINLPCALIYAASGAVAACAGVLFTLYNAFVTPTVLHWTTSGACLVMAIVGGPRIVWGPALGALAFFLLKDIVGDAATLWPAIVGTVLVVITLTLPQGISDPVQRGFRAIGRRWENRA